MFVHGFKVAENEYSFACVFDPEHVDYFLQFQINTRTNERQYNVMTKDGQIFELVSGTKHIRREDALEFFRGKEMNVAKLAAQSLVDSSISVYNPQHEKTGFTPEDIRVIIKRFSVLKQYSWEQINEDREQRT